MINAIVFFSVLCVVLGVLWAIVDSSRRRKAQSEVDKQAEDLGERAFKAFPGYRGKPGVWGNTSALVLDESRLSALLIVDGFAKELSFDDILSAQIVTDGVSVTSSQKSGTFGRVVTGGLIAGGAGAIIGAITAKSVQKTVSSTTSIDLVVETSDPQFPLLSWNFFSPNGLMQDIKSYEMWIYIEPAVEAYNVLAPAFTTRATEENGLVEI